MEIKTTGMGQQVYSYKLVDCEVKDVDKKSRKIKGYFAAFNIKDSDGDVIRPGSFAKTIMENGPQSGRPRIKHLLNHSPWEPLGKLIDLKEDDYGLLYGSEIGSHTLGNDFLKMVDSGLITEHSIGYQVTKWERDEEDDGDRTTYLNELKLWEGSSLTAWGANEFTPLVSAKGQKIDVLTKRMKAIEKFCDNTDASDETIQLLLLQIKQMHQYILDMKSSTKPAKATQPRNDIEVPYASALSELRELFV